MYKHIHATHTHIERIAILTILCLSQNDVVHPDHSTTLSLVTDLSLWRIWFVVITWPWYCPLHCGISYVYMLTRGYHIYIHPVGEWLISPCGSHESWLALVCPASKHCSKFNSIAANSISAVLYICPYMYSCMHGCHRVQSQLSSNEAIKLVSILVTTHQTNVGDQSGCTGL